MTLINSQFVPTTHITPPPATAGSWRQPPVFSRVREVSNRNTCEHCQHPGSFEVGLAPSRSSDDPSAQARSRGEDMGAGVQREAMQTTAGAAGGAMPSLPPFVNSPFATALFEHANDNPTLIAGVQDRRNGGEDRHVSFLAAGINQKRLLGQFVASALGNRSPMLADGPLRGPLVAAGALNMLADRSLAETNGAAASSVDPEIVRVARDDLHAALDFLDSHQNTFSTNGTHDYANGAHSEGLERLDGAVRALAQALGGEQHVCAALMQQWVEPLVHAEVSTRFPGTFKDGSWNLQQPFKLEDWLVGAEGLSPWAGRLEAARDQTGPVSRLSDVILELVKLPDLVRAAPARAAAEGDDGKSPKTFTVTTDRGAGPGREFAESTPGSVAINNSPWFHPNFSPVFENHNAPTPAAAGAHSDEVALGALRLVGQSIEQLGKANAHLAAANERSDQAAARSAELFREALKAIANLRSETPATATATGGREVARANPVLGSTMLEAEPISLFEPTAVRMHEQGQIERDDTEPAASGSEDPVRARIEPNEVEGLETREGVVEPVSDGRDSSVAQTSLGTPTSVLPEQIPVAPQTSQQADDIDGQALQALHTPHTRQRSEEARSNDASYAAGSLQEALVRARLNFRKVDSSQAATRSGIIPTGDGHNVLERAVVQPPANSQVETALANDRPDSQNSQQDPASVAMAPVLSRVRTARPGPIDVTRAHNFGVRQQGVVELRRHAGALDSELNEATGQAQSSRAAIRRQDGANISRLKAQLFPDVAVSRPYRSVSIDFRTKTESGSRPVSGSYDLKAPEILSPYRTRPLSYYASSAAHDSPLHNIAAPAQEEGAVMRTVRESQEEGGRT